MASPTTLKEFIQAIRDGLICERCGKYVGSLAPTRYLPPPYPIALDRIADDEVEALVGYEWHMLDRLRRGDFVIRHPQRDGQCVRYRDWVADDEDDEVDEAES